MSKSKYGLRILNYEAATLYETNIGVRQYPNTTPAMFVNSLLKDFLMNHGLKLTSTNSTRDIICLNFKQGTQSYKQNRDRLFNIIANETDVERISQLTEILSQIELKKDKFEKISIDELRRIYYTQGVDITYTSYKRNKEIKSQQTIHYKMLYRSTGKAKNGSCMFINEKLWKCANDFITMGLKLPKNNSPIVEMSAYQSLVASSIVDTIYIKPENILIVKDVDSIFERDVVSIETNDKKQCIAKDIKDYQLKNTLFDGQALIDSSIFPSWANGFVLLRHHMCKMAAFSSNIQLFFYDYFKEDYDTAKVVDMFGNQHYAKDIKLITTDNAVKWLKFGVSYEYWCDRVHENGCQFGIVKTAHPSKLGDVQKMSYQMVNALDMDSMEDVVSTSKKYIEDMKRDDKVFIDYLKNNGNYSNDYEVLVALCEQNWDFTRSEYFRARKYEIIKGYIKKFRFGKVIQHGDNLTIVGSPYAMLLHSVGEDAVNDTTMQAESGCIQCCTEQFDDEYIAEFRSPFNSRNNMGYLHNVKSDIIDKYFNLGKQVIAINMIGTDFQDRNNGSDQDSDMIYCTNYAPIVKHARHCYINYPTIVNNILKEKNKYKNTLLDRANIDNNLAKAQRAIGESSNLAQIALTYTYNFSDKKYKDYVCILSVLAQCAIDNAKRKYDVDLSKEIRRIKKDLDITTNGYPIFWKYVKREGRYEINPNLRCPMNYLCKLKFARYNSQESTLPMDYFFKKFELKEDRRKSKKVEKLIEKYSIGLYELHKINDSTEIEESVLISMDDFDIMIEDLQKTYISKDYVGLMSWLIDRAFCITFQTKGNYESMDSNTEQNKSILLKTLYSVNKGNLLEIFSRNS